MLRRNVNDTTIIRPQKRLGEMLIDDDIITQSQLKKALEQQRESGGFLGQVLIEQNAVSQDTLISYLAKQCQIPHLSLLNYRIGEEALAQVPRELCLKHYLVPVDKMGRILTLAMVDPLDTEALEEIKKHCPDLRIKPVLCSWEHFQATVKQVYSQEIAKPDNLEEKYSYLGALSQVRATPEEAIDKSSSSFTDEDATLDNTENASRSASFSKSQTREESQELADQKSSEAALAAEDSSIKMMAEALRKSIREAFSGLVTESVASSRGEGQLVKIAEAMMQSLESEKSSLAEKEKYLANIAESALESVRQTAQLVESHTQERSSGSSDSQRHRQANYVSVVPFIKADSEDTADKAGIHLEPDDKVRDALASERSQETYTFENFLPGAANEFLMKLARSVVEKPGGDYTPLFLYSSTGLGKTHLLNAIGNATIASKTGTKAKAQLRPGYVSTGHFFRCLMSATSEDALELFRDDYCRWDTVMFDDIQFLGGRLEAQEEFFHIFDVLQQQGRQVIVTADKAPELLQTIEARLLSRLASGIVVELKPPELNTRIAILRQHAQAEGVEIPEEVLVLIAKDIPDDIRKMTGALRKIIVFSRLESAKIVLEDAKRILNHRPASKSG